MANPDQALEAPLTARLRGGEMVLVRPLSAADEEPLCRFMEGLCPEARRLRFFSGGIDIEHLAHDVAATGRGRLGLLALDGEGAIVGHAVAITLAPGLAEVALEVADELHGEGLGTILVERLAELAERRGIETFLAQVLPENRAMLEVFREGFDARVSWREGVDRVEFPTSAWRLARARYPSPPGEPAKP